MAVDDAGGEQRSYKGAWLELIVDADCIARLPRCTEDPQLHN